MSKTKDSGVKHYEILFILPNKFTDEEAKKVSEQVEEKIVANSGKVTNREYWGKKRLAYKIKGNAFGYYGLLEFDLEGINLAKVDLVLRLSTDVLRHQIVVKKPKTEEQIATEQKIRAKITAKKAAEVRKDQEEKVKTVEAAALASKGTDKRAKLKDLDEKLEDILSASDLIK
jgi:small subunit ribosomal protein S6